MRVEEMCRVTLQPMGLGADDLAFYKHDDKYFENAFSLTDGWSLNSHGGGLKDSSIAVQGIVPYFVDYPCLLA
jgi:hypothetical protein